MSKSANASTQSTSAKSSAPTAKKVISSDRTQLVKALVDLYAAQNGQHGKTEQKQFYTLIQSHWAEMPKPLQTEIRKKLALRTDMSDELFILLGLNKKEAPLKKEEKATTSKAAASEQPQKKAPEAKALKSKAKTNDAIQQAEKSAPWFETPASYFQMKIEDRQAALLELSEKKFEFNTLYPIPAYKFDAFKRNYYANKRDLVQAELVENLHISQEIAKFIVDDKDMIGICIAARALGANEKDITSIVIFNSGQFSNPSFDAFERIKWFAQIPQIAVQQMMHVWQGKASTVKSNAADIKQNIQPSELGLAQKSIEKPKSEHNTPMIKIEKSPRQIIFNAAQAFKKINHP